MSFRPLDVPVIATNAVYGAGPTPGQPTKVAPVTALQQDGWRPRQEPAAAQFNYVENAQSLHARYLDAIDVSNFRAAPKDWDDATFGFATSPDVRTPTCISWRYPGEIVVVGDSAGASSAAVTRNEGRTWYEENLPITTAPRGVAFVGATTAAAEAGYATSDGVQGAYYTVAGGWTLDTPANQLTGAGVIASPGAAGMLLIFGGVAAGPGVWRSSAAAAVQCTVPALAGHVMREVAWGGVGVGFLGISDDGATTRHWTSPTGATWTNTGVTAGGTGARVAWDAARALWLRVGGNGAAVHTSPDGVTWTAAGAGLPGPLVFEPGHSVRRVFARGGVWIACTTTANAGVKIAYVWASTDGGSTWVAANAALLTSSVTTDLAAHLAEGTTERLILARATGISLSLRAR